jgi:GxxExxY protein
MVEKSLGVKRKRKDVDQYVNVNVDKKNIKKPKLHTHTVNDTVNDINNHLIQLLLEHIIVISNNIFKELGTGNTESVYHRALEVELRNLGVQYSSEVVTPIMYKGMYVGYGRADVVLPGILVIELKAISSDIRFVELAKTRTYMKSLDIHNGILINFPQNSKKKCIIRVID